MYSNYASLFVLSVQQLYGNNAHAHVYSYIKCTFAARHLMYNSTWISLLYLTSFMFK